MRHEVSQRRPVTGHRHRKLIHLLNQRYRHEFDRAERLQAELAAIRHSRAWQAMSWWRKLKHWLWPAGENATGAQQPHFGTTIYRPRSVPDCKVSIVIPFRDQPRLLKGCLASLQRGSYRRLEVILVDNGSQEHKTFRLLQKLAGRRGWHIHRVAAPFNFSRLCNVAARHATGEFLLFLNNDTEVISSDWVEQMLVVAQRDDVGVVGATLFYPDRTIQHVGIAPVGGSWVHLYRGRPYNDPGDDGELRNVRAVPAVTGACLMIRRSLFANLGGFDEQLPVVGNDIDLCRRVREMGLTVAVTPFARLIHFECLSRGYSAESYCA
jgi:GT2 family glycosyltransferase